MSTNKYLAKIQADRDAAVDAGVNSTPTFFINGENIGGLQEYGNYRVKIEKALAEPGMISAWNELIQPIWAIRL